MKTEDGMNIHERRKYLRLTQKRYRKASRKGKAQLLDEMGTVTGMHRKTLVRLMNSDLERKPRRKQRGRSYGVQVHYALKVISESVDHICAERVQPNLTWLAEHLARHGELETTPELLAKLGKISVPTVRRIQARLQQDQPRLPRKGPVEANQAARAIPIGRIDWNEQQPGRFEVDLVHHCGPAASGHYAHSLQMIDVATGWSERMATLGRGYLVMRDGFLYLQTRMPFPVKGIHSDNGSEFLNDHMIRFWQEEVGGVELSRGRPYHKNDQRFVEQKNSTLIRAYLGYERLDTATQTNALNLLYDKMWLFYNFFQPVMRLESKTVVTDENGVRRVKRRHDQAQTPLDRLIATRVLSPERQVALEVLRDQTNPRQLRQEIYDGIGYIFSLPGATPEKTEDVFQTLLMSSASDDQKGCGYVDNCKKTQLPTYPQPLLLRRLDTPLPKSGRDSESEKGRRGTL